MLKKIKKLIGCITTMAATVCLALPVFAQETAEAAAAAADGSPIGAKAIAAGIAIGLAALGGAVGMGWSIAKSAEAVSRQPEAQSKIQTLMMLGLVFIETAIIYALVIAILIIFVL